MRVSIRGATENNLHYLDLDLEDGLTVVTGVSGSGKTSLVFDTLYHESRRRFLESFASGAAAFSLPPAAVRSITGLGPAVAIGQNLLNRNPASTLASASGLHPFFRLLYARFGQRACPACQSPLLLLSEDEIVEQVVACSQVEPCDCLAPLVHGALGSHKLLLGLLHKEFGAQSLLVDGQPWSGRPLDPSTAHSIDVVLASSDSGFTLFEARDLLRQSAALGVSALLLRGAAGEWTFSRAPVCARCGRWFGRIEPHHFAATCPECQGEGCAACDYTGLTPEASSVRWRGLRFPDLLIHSVSEARELFRQPGLPSTASRLLNEIIRRLDALDTVGLGYVHLNRSSPTLSRGESQRVRLAIALTSRLEDMLHVLDEPTVGQHPYDVKRLLPAFRQLAGPVVYVEHDRAAAAVADHAVDLGPGAGSRGGRLLYAGSPAGLWEADTPTGRYFSLRERPAEFHPRTPSGERLLVREAGLHNLQKEDVAFPLGCLVVVSGISGSGKSTLVEDVLVASLQAGKPLGCLAVEGPRIRATLVDQGPIGVNPRSNAATYTGLADIIRDVFSTQTGLSPSHFSFNRPEGACPTCAGMGAVEIKMRYLPSSWVPCADCAGQRFRDEVLEKHAVFDGRSFSIADFYRLPVEQALSLLLASPALPRARRAAAAQVLHALVDVGLGYLPLGQPSPSLSGGEAQRVKLTKYLGRRSLSGELLVLDEPSTGLHPQDVAALLVVLDRLVRSGATVLIVEHNLDFIRAADWVIDLGPGAGPLGGQLVYSGPPSGLLACPERSVGENKESFTAQALREEKEIQPRDQPLSSSSTRGDAIRIRGARANNLQNVSVDFPKGALSVVTGVSGSGKSSLVSDILEAEARRRFLESLSMYERQGVREGPEAEVESVSGLGVTASLGTDRDVYDRRATVGTVTEIIHKLAVLFAVAGERDCPACGTKMARDSQSGWGWLCPACVSRFPAAQPRHFLPSNYSSACLKCHGVGTLPQPNPGKLIIHPDKPLCAGAMFSPGFFPKGYLGKPFNGGYDMLQALAARYSFNPFTTPWDEMTPAAQQAFLFGDPQPMPVTFRSRTGRTRTQTLAFPGFYGWIRDWDVGGTYTDTRPCPECGGTRLRPEFTAVRLSGHPLHHLSSLPLEDLYAVLYDLPPLESRLADMPEARLAAPGLQTALRRMQFLLRVGLGYLHLDRLAATLSAGEAQRIRLAGLLGSDLTSLTILLDEPTRGLHPSEVEALLGTLQELRSAGNTVIVVEHEPLIITSADYLVDMGPGAGALGGQIVAQGPPSAVLAADTLTARCLRSISPLFPSVPADTPDPRLQRAKRSCVPLPDPGGGRGVGSFLTLRGARANNLRGDEVRFPLGLLTGVCGVSGSGKSTLVIDTLGRILVPKKYTTSTAREPVDPGEYDSIEGAPARAVLIDQVRAGVTSPLDFLGLKDPLVRLFAAGEDALALGLGAEQLSRRCSACGGHGTLHLDMGFLPSLHTPCETCRGTGLLPEAWQVHLAGISLPTAFGLTIAEVLDLFPDEPSIARPLSAACDAGLGYLVLRQPGYTLSGGEAQRLKIAAELCRKAPTETLYILDEPTVGQHLDDVARLAGVLRRLVAVGHTVIVVEHHSQLLAVCDWLIELGPGGGPRGGRVIFSGPPAEMAMAHTPTAPYIKAALEVHK